MAEQSSKFVHHRAPLRPACEKLRAEVDLSSPPKSAAKYIFSLFNISGRFTFFAAFIAATDKRYLALLARL
jgi:hypothetical protein